MNQTEMVLSTAQMPEAVRKISEEVVSHVHDGTKMPDDLWPLYAWLTDDGCSEKTAAFHDGYAIKLFESADRDGEDSAPLVHSFPVQDAYERTAILGVTLGIHAKKGPVPVWHGPFRTRDAFYEALRAIGYYMIPKGKALP